MKATEKFQVLHIDIVGPLPMTANENKYIISMIDKYSIWPELVAAKDMTAYTVAQAVIDNWISRYGCPAIIITDQGRQFESNMFGQLCHTFGIEKRRSTPYHPQTNGAVERMHRTMKQTLRCLAQNNAALWDKHLQHTAICVCGI